MTGATIMGAEAVATLDGRYVDGGNIEKLKTHLAVYLMGHSPPPRFERVKARLIEFVPDSPELHEFGSRHFVSSSTALNSANC